jgi:hypothetical protein
MVKVKESRQKNIAIERRTIGHFITFDERELDVPGIEPIVAKYCA